MTTINTLECPGEFDALVKLRPGEPYFPLIGRDRLAPPLILQWAENNRTRARRRGLTGEALEAEFRQSSQAEEIAWAMQEYHTGAPKAERAENVVRVNNAGKTNLPPETVERDREQRTRSMVAAACHNSAAELLDAAQAIRQYDPAVTAALEAFVNWVKALAAEAKPARPALEKIA